jgi:rhodanese-related sulfurtransferase
MCHHGSRSAQVAQWVARNGVDRVHNLAGGIDAWSRTVDPAIPRY